MLTNQAVHVHRVKGIMGYMWEEAERRDMTYKCIVLILVVYSLISY